MRSDLHDMRAVRLSLCFFALILALALSGCDQTPTAQGKQQNVSPPVVRHLLRPTATAGGHAHVEENANPAHLLIPTIGINASIETVGVSPNGDLAIPTQNPWEHVGWYDLGPRPGERGSAVIDGHLDRPGGYPAVFWRLRDMQIGNSVMVIDTRGKTFHFHVTAIAFYAPQDAPIQEIFANESGTYLNLITCAGDWIPSQHQTTLRLVIYTALD